MIKCVHALSSGHVCQIVVFALFDIKQNQYIQHALCDLR